MFRLKYLVLRVQQRQSLPRVRCHRAAISVRIRELAHQPNTLLVSGGLLAPHSGEVRPRLRCDLIHEVTAGFGTRCGEALVDQLDEIQWVAFLSGSAQHTRDCRVTTPAAYRGFCGCNQGQDGSAV